jgi:hypothetical protein
MPVHLDHDGKWRANLLFDAAGLTTLPYYSSTAAPQTAVFHLHCFKASTSPAKGEKV